MLTLFISGKESVKIENIDVYMELLLEEVEMLWKGVITIDVTQPQGS